MTTTVTAADVRTRLLDAAEECFQRFGISQTTMDDVIRAARIPRTTAYRHVGSKSELINAVTLRNGIRFLEGLGERLASLRTFEDVLVEGLMLSIDECVENELTAAAFGIEDVVAVHASTVQYREEWFRAYVAFMAPRLEPARELGLLRPGVTDEDVTEWAIRTILSFALLGDLQDRDREERREFLRRVYLPAVVAEQ